MPRFFLSYRRSDTQGQYLAHMVFREISKRYGKNSVFMDVDSSSPGLSFPKKLEQALAQSDAVLVIIGNEWLTRLNEKREDERDWVRFEISESLKREGLPVVPICNVGVNLPAPSQLPPDIRDLAMRDGVLLDPFRDFDAHLSRFLIDLRFRRNRLNAWSAGALAGFALVLAVVLQFDIANLMPRGTSGPQPDLKNPQVSGEQSPAKPIPDRAAATTDTYPAKPFVVFRDTLKDGAPGPEMVSLPGGNFQMGSPPTEAGRYDDEGPQHWVSLQAFAISRTEVSFADYDRFVAATGRKKPDQSWGRDTQPVINVNWQGAKDYAQWLSQQTGKKYRLPTEAEWEYAARAGTTTAFWTGNCIDTDKANYDGNFDYSGCGAKTGKYRQQTVPVGSLPANPWGLHEMAGNVWEWTEDCWHGNYQNAPSNGAAWLDANGGDCARRVLRGGSWGLNPRNLRSAYRSRYSADEANGGVGIRLARTP